MTILACGGDDNAPPTEEELRLIEIAGSGNGITWTATSVTFESLAVTFFDGMTLTLRTASTGETYSSTNADPVFGTNGTFAINPSNLNQITIDGNANNIFNITNLDSESTPATMTLTVNFTETGGGIEGISGTYVFNLEHN